MKHRHTFDARKRHTLKGITSIGAAGVLGAVPALSASAALVGGIAPSATVRHQAGVALDATLISSPDVAENTLLLRNPTNSDVVITHFHANKLVFDGDIVDCNDACARAAIRVPAGREISVSFYRQDDEHPASIGSQFLDVASVVERLPEGTRVIPLEAQLRGNAAVLALLAAPAVAA